MFERRLTLINRLLYGVSIILLITIVLYALSFVVFGRDSEVTIYPIAFGNNSDDLFAIPIIIFLLIGVSLAVLSILSRWLVGKHFQNHLAARAVFVVLLANGLMCFGMPFISLFGYGILSYHDTLTTLQLNDHTYYLTRYGYDAVESYNVHYSVYECDRFGVFCWRLQTFSSVLNTIPITAVEQIDLIQNPADNTIQVHINSEVVWTYTP